MRAVIAKVDIEQALEEKLSGTPLFTVLVDVKDGNRIKVLVDGDEGITIDQCVEINRFLLKRFDRDQEDYALEVSSPGLGEPLRLERQYRKNIGRALEVQLKNGEAVRGTLSAVTPETLTLQKEIKKGNKKKSKTEATEDSDVTISMEDIASAKVKVVI
ncbi:MAG: ribosome assembly cofactor RimP [Flavobacteriales bacterium]|nr:ribosome assembly cofactor RimP [Flavobacteriales bacterium]